MKSQQQADREEQQRIKNLVLNYEMANDNETANTEGRYWPMRAWLLRPTNADQTLVPEKRTPPRDTRMDKSAANRTAFRSRKLQLSDVNW